MEKNTKRAEKIVGGYATRLKGFAFALPDAHRLIAGSIAALGIRAFIQGIKTQLDDLGRVFDRSISLGIAPQSLKGLEFAGQLAGVAAEEIGTAITKMQKKIAEAADGNQEATKTFERLGVSAKDLRLLTPDKQLELVSDALAKIEAPSDRVRIAMDLFGRSGARLISLFSEGGAGLRAATEDYRRLGGAISEADFAAADMAGDSLLRMTTAFSNLKQNLVVSATPAITLFTDSLAALTGSAAVAARSQFTLSRWYLGFSKIAGDFLSIPHSPLQKGGGPVKASDILEEEWQRIMRDMDAAVARGAALRDIKIPDAEEAATNARQAQPGAVDFGTRAAIEAMNKAFGATENTDKKQLRVMEQARDGIKDLNRAFARIQPSQPANIVG